MRKIKVLVVDDSLLFRNLLVESLRMDPSIEVVAQAGDAYAARDAILQYRPDVMTLDVEMPRMGGIEFLRRLLPQYPLPVVVISALSPTRPAFSFFAAATTASGGTSFPKSKTWKP